ncbi:MAG: hypothetical protein LBL92_07890 [Propionibacteriaceae bacterium]|jgi:hypothetical protein|nr:hypothetical protein [Propionibacteriaceae bacterium]
MISNKDGSKFITIEEFDRLFDEGEVDVLEYFDVEHGTYPGREKRTVAIDLPAPIFQLVQKESARSGTDVESLIEEWIAEKSNGVAA